ncbi:MAG: hypothetical protein K2H78_00465 [Clostridia bacterium]|nr:hypothetical protein [Clostridia bacterium]
MKKKVVLIILSLVCALTCAFGLAACGKKYSYELVSATLSDSEYNQDWIYVDNSAVKDIVNYPPELRYVFDVTLKRNDGNTVNGTLDLTYSGSGSQGSASVNIGGDSYYMDTMLRFDISGYDASEIAENKELTVKLSGNASDSKINGGECDVKVDYSVVHAIKNFKLLVPVLEYQLNDEMDLSDVKVELEYEDDTEETVGFDKILTMPQMNGSSITGFDSSSYGHKTIRVTVSCNDGGRSSSNSYYYNVNPDSAVWTKKTASGYIYHTTEDMAVTSLQQNGTRFTKVAFGNENKATMLMLYGTGVLLSVEASDFENMLNYTSQGNNLLHRFMPSGETATVTKMEKTPAYKINYYNTDAEGNKTSENILYVVYESRTGKIVAIKLADVDKLSQEELDTADEFVNLVWF